MMEAMINPLLFLLATGFSIWMIFKASGNHVLALLIPILLAGISGIAAVLEWFKPSLDAPPVLFIFPGTALMVIIYLFVRPVYRNNLLQWNLRYLTLLHVVRIPVEVSLYLLSIAGTIPELMTFEGDNPDIICGITAPVAALFFFRGQRIGKNGLLIWNVLCLISLFNIVIRAVLSVPGPLQQLGFDQPNTAVFNFPYIWLPGVVVPIVLFSHLISLAQLLRKQ